MSNYNESHMMILRKHDAGFINVSERRCSRWGLYISQSLFVIGSWLMLFNHIGVFPGDTYLWSFSLVEMWIVMIGIMINFGCVPYLYFSSLLKYKKNDSFWNVETSWILFLFFAGMFFQYGAKHLYILNMLVIIILTTFVVHVRYMVISRRVSNLNIDAPEKYLYFETMKYLAAYYVVIIALFILFDPFKFLQAWF